MASVAGLAPARVGLKIRLRELLCIHGQKMVPKVGIAPTSPSLQGGANLPQLLGEMVVLRGNAPRSSGYQPGALLLSYGTMADGVGIAPTQPGGSLGFRDRGITALPTIRNGQGGRSCTCDLRVPSKPVCC
jgi:hypothetical protein